MTSCKSTFQTYYQICEVKSDLPQKGENGAYYYDDNTCVISYDFWKDGGNPGFKITNNSDEIINVDLSQSFFVRNGIAYDYYLNRSLTSNVTSSSSSSVSKFSYLFGAVGNSNSLTMKTGTTYNEKSTISIPPHSSKYIDEYSISSNYFNSCAETYNPKHKHPASYSYNLLESPLTFNNYITYYVGESTSKHVIENRFYVGGVTYYHAKDALIKKQVGCNEKDSKLIQIVRDSHPTNFYIKYLIEIKYKPSE
jgi:hypothetical protein